MLCPSDYRERLVPRHAGWFPRLGQGALPRSRMPTTTLWVPPVLCSVCGARWLARCLRLHTTTTAPPSPPRQQRPHLCLPPLHPLLTSRVHLAGTAVGAPFRGRLLASHADGSRSRSPPNAQCLLGGRHRRSRFTRRPHNPAGRTTRLSGGGSDPSTRRQRGRVQWQRQWLWRLLWR